MAEIPTPFDDYSTQERTRPIGVTIISILMILGALFNLFLVTAFVGFSGLFYTGYNIMIGIVNLIIGIALFQLIPWSRIAAIIIQGIGILFSVASTLSVIGYIGGYFVTFFIISILPSLIFSLIIIIYLMQGSVKAAFQGSQW